VDKAVVTSILLFTLIIPFFAARAKTTRGAVQRAVIATVIACVLYLLGLLFLYTTTPKFNV
jgi:hypothetical protein